MKKPTVFVVFLEKLFPYGIVIARMTHVPFIRRILKRLLFHQTNLMYLPKDTAVEIQLNTYIEPPDNIVLPSQVVDQFIRDASYRFIMDFCICRQAMDCKDYPQDLGCLFLGEGTKEINPAYGKEASVEEALAHMKKCRDAGLVHLIGRDHIDKTWLQVKSGEKLMTICNCCSCCCLWKWLPALDPTIRAKVKRMPGVTVTVTKNCVGCGACVSACFMHAISLKKGKAVIDEECRGCGRCVEICPSHAIELHIDDENALEKTKEHVTSSVDIH